MKNKHYDMIVAKAENMDLVVFFNPSFGSSAEKWEEATTTLFPAFHPETDYFLCLPQHKEACLHWLNGGDVQDFFEEEWSDCASLAHATEVGGDNTLEFSMHHMFMNEEFNFRIAPKKEKPEEGGKCPLGCEDSELQYQTHNCVCNAYNAPCWYCENATLECNQCGNEFVEE